MKTLNRPMFRYGGPIKEGIMTGMQDRPGYKKGSLIGGLISKAPGGQSLIDYGRGIIPRLFNKIKPTFKMQPGKITQNKTIIGNKPDGTPIFGYSGTGQKYASQTMPPVPFMERAGAFVKENPYFTGVAAPFAISTGSAVIPPVVEGGLSLGKKALLQAADLAVPDFIFDQDKYLEDKNMSGVTTERDGLKISRDKKSKVVNTPNTSGTGEGTKQEINEDRIQETKNRYYKLMGIDKMNKDATYDSLIDASKIIQQEGGDLKGSIKSGSLQSQLISAISKNLDKSSALKKQIDAAVLKGEIEKDIKASDPSSAVDLAYKKAATAKIQKDLKGSSAAEVLAQAEIQGKNIVTSNTLRSILESKGTKVDFAFPDDKYQKWFKNNEGKDELNYLQENYGTLKDGLYVVNKKAFEITDGTIFPVDLDEITG